jgi:hypothetical protein
VTGLIYVAIIAVWAVVLVPAWLRRHDHLDSERSVDRFTRSLHALSKRDSVLGIPLPHADEAQGRTTVSRGDDVAPEVRTVNRPTATNVGTRISGLVSGAGSRAGATSAAARRRVVLGVLAAGLAVVAGLVVGGILLPIALVVPVGLIVAFVAAARHQVRTAQRGREVHGRRLATTPAASAPVPRRVVAGQTGETWEARPTTLPTYVTAPPAAEFPRVIDTTPGAWTAAAMLERAQQQKDRAERMAAAKAEAIARAKAEQAAAEARSRDEEFLAQQSAAWQAQDTATPVYRPRAVNE